MVISYIIMLGIVNSNIIHCILIDHYNRGCYTKVKGTQGTSVDAR